MIKQNLLYATVIENDGRTGKQFTFLGSVLVGAVVVIIGVAILFFINPTLFAFI